MLFREVDINSQLVVGPAGGTPGVVAHLYVNVASSSGWVNLTRDDARLLIETLEEALS
jgi:hypothetical protein